ncbi:MAG: hypothetical protein ACD_2C00091G0015 [uncultured bacterium (gcode 4)]|uniref:DUF4010 domain-containing protein n=1 Tax=uncultured bacterium (gcode 4) TaxID=1234023 RepID=K2GHB3_9BACT|nr:MAG: hypothetical protein ACD_2C00091G0015 [uncultured bacterium (gcode 4)]
MELDFFLKILVASVLWGLIWLERDISHKNQLEQFAWLRSYALIAFLGAIWTILDQVFVTKFIFSITLFVLFSLIVASAYIYAAFKKNDIGITSELAAFLTFFIWTFVWLGFLKVSIIFTITLILIISLKEWSIKLKERIWKDEFMHTLKFAVIAFVVLPLLPDAKFSIWNLLSFLWMAESWITHPIMNMAFFNPYSVWFFVVVMSAVWYVWYVLSKIFGKNSSVVLSSLIWWMVSSTAVTATMSENSKADVKNPYIYVMWVLAANSVMLIRVVWIVLVLNIALLKNLYLPALLMLVWFAVVMLYSYRKSKEAASKTKVDLDEKMESPFSLAPALKFWLFILFIKFIAWIWLLYKELFLGDFFYYIFWIISWFADVDAITQTMATQSQEWSVTAKLAITTILLAVMSNNVVKSSMAYKFWWKVYWKIVMGAFWLSIVLGLAGIFLS